MKKIAFFDTKPYDRTWFDILAKHYEIAYFEEKLNRHTASKPSVSVAVWTRPPLTGCTAAACSFWHCAARASAMWICKQQRASCAWYACPPIPHTPLRSTPWGFY